MEQGSNKKKVENTGLFTGIIFLTAVCFLANHLVPFMMDDLWYSTNLVTGERLQSLQDIWESQVWHFFHWGGRSMTHAALQLVLMTGEGAADLLNVAMTLLLALLSCILAGRRSLFSFLTVFAMMSACNANLKMSMLWQAGVVNYVYAGCFILLFILPYGAILENKEPKLKGLAVLMLPLGILAGWSNENMGILCFAVSLWGILYQKKVRKAAVKAWMIIGSVSSMVGAVLVIAAPGNFVRSGTIEKKGFLQMIGERFYSMLTAGGDFLFPVYALITIASLVWIVCYRQKLKNTQILLLAFCILSFGAMVMSPHYPDRATFGSMVMGITYFVSVMGDLEEKDGRWHGAKLILLVLFFAGALLRYGQVIYSL